VISSLLFFSQGTSYERPLVYVGWSLEYDLLFYVSMAISIMVFRQTWLRLSLTAALIIGLVFVIPWFSPQALEFCIGMMVAIVFKNIKLSRIVHWVLILTGAGLATLLFLVLNDLDRWAMLGIPFGVLVLVQRV